MEKNTTSARMYAHLVLFDMHTSFLGKALEGISNDDAHNRLNTKANHMAWLTGSLVQERYELAKELGINLSQSANELFHDHKGIQEGMRYPPLDSFNKDWEIISPLLRDALLTVTDERLNKPFEMPGEKMSFYDLISFTIYREANCIGQLALWRRLLGYKALNYMES
ncbi:MAG: DinB family protein [Ferruginibacter sp.]